MVKVVIGEARSIYKARLLVEIVAGKSMEMIFSQEMGLLLCFGVGGEVSVGGVKGEVCVNKKFYNISTESKSCCELKHWKIGSAIIWFTCKRNFYIKPNIKKQISHVKYFTSHLLTANQTAPK